MSLFRKRLWPLGQAAKTAPSHGAIMGSIPVGVTKKIRAIFNSSFLFISIYLSGIEKED